MWVPGDAELVIRCLILADSGQFTLGVKYQAGGAAHARTQIIGKHVLQLA